MDSNSPGRAHYLNHKRGREYGKETYNDFMGRSPAPIASALNIHNSDDFMDIAIISALAIAGIAAAGAFVFLRRKKEA